MTDVVQEVTRKGKPVKGDAIEVPYDCSGESGLFVTDSKHGAPGRVRKGAVIELVVGCDGRTRKAKFVCVSVIDEREEFKMCSKEMNCVFHVGRGPEFFMTIQLLRIESTEISDAGKRKNTGE